MTKTPKFSGLNHEEILRWNFYIACENGDIDELRSIISKVDVNVDNGKGLLTACMNNHTDLVRLLVENGANTNLNNSRELYCAIKNANYEIAKILVENGINIYSNPNIDANEKIFSLAAKYNNPSNIAILKLLIDKDRKQKKGVSIYQKQAIKYAKCFCNEEAILYFIEMGLLKSKQESLKVILIERKENDLSEKQAIEYIRMECKNGAKVDYDQQWALRYAVKNNLVEETKCLLELGADINKCIIDTSKTCVQQNNCTLLAIILDAVTEDKYTFHKFKKIFFLHLQKFGFKTEYGNLLTNIVPKLYNQLLIDASRLGSIEIVEYLLTKEADKNLIEQFGKENIKDWYVRRERYNSLNNALNTKDMASGITSHKKKI